MSRLIIAARADELRKQADELDRIAARQLPEKWELGMRVRYLATSDWAWTKGDIAYVNRLRPEYIGKPADEYQVFYTGPMSQAATFWTTPDDVELVSDDGVKK
jgi:hypothetical protein